MPHAVRRSGSLCFLGLALLASARAAQNYNFTTFAGAPNLAGTVDGAGAAARFEGPSAMAIDGNGDLYVAEPHSIRKVTPGGVVSTIATNLTYPEALAIDPAGNIFRLLLPISRARGSGNESC